MSWIPAIETGGHGEDLAGRLNDKRCEAGVRFVHRAGARLRTGVAPDGRYAVGADGRLFRGDVAKGDARACSGAGIKGIADILVCLAHALPSDARFLGVARSTALDQLTAVVRHRSALVQAGRFVVIRGATVS